MFPPLSMDAEPAVLPKTPALRTEQHRWVAGAGVHGINAVELHLHSRSHYAVDRAGCQNSLLTRVISIGTGNLRKSTAMQSFTCLLAY